MKGAHGPCGSGPTLESSGYGLVGLIDHIREGESVCASDCFSQWTEACPLPDNTAVSVADAFFNNIICHFGMPSVIHSDQGREFENKVMHELCLLGGSHKTRTTPYHPESNSWVERFNRTLLMMLAMFAGENKDDWDDLLPAVMMAYRSSVHESTRFSPYRLMFGEECTLPMDIGLPRQDPEPLVWVRDTLEVAFDQVRRYSGQAVQRQKRLYDQRAVWCLFAIGDWAMRYYPAGKKCKLDWPVSRGVYHRLGGGYPEASGHASDIDPLSGCEESSPAEWGAVVD